MRWIALALLAAFAAVPVAPVHADEAPAAAATAEAENPVQALFQARKYQDAVLKAAELRTAAKKPVADAESEYWAARAESSMKLIGAARERMQLIARTYPDTKRGTDAAIEATTVVLNSLGERPLTAPADIKTAIANAKELEATAARLKDPEGISRAWYVAGNAWRKAGDIPATANAHRQSAAVAGAVDYPARSLYSLATIALQDFDVATARKHMDDCIKKYPSSAQAERCGRSVGRLELVGQPAPQFDVEVWVNGPPQDIDKLKGRVVLVWFFATWCPHCKLQMPEMAKYKDMFSGQPLTVIAVTNNGRGQTTESAAQFIADPQWQITYPAAVDAPGGATSFAYQGTGIPAAVLVDKKGIVRWADHPAYLTEALIKKLLAEP